MVARQQLQTCSARLSFHNKRKIDKFCNSHALAFLHHGGRQELSYSIRYSNVWKLQERIQTSGSTLDNGSYIKTDNNFHWIVIHSDTASDLLETQEISDQFNDDCMSRTEITTIDIEIVINKIVKIDFFMMKDHTVILSFFVSYLLLIISQLVLQLISTFLDQNQPIFFTHAC